MAIGEEGEDIGFTYGDLMGEVSPAIVQLLDSQAIKKLEGDGWKVYKVPPNTVRADIDVGRVRQRG